jgi:mono/diheme cytochrome c family protein
MRADRTVRRTPAACSGRAAALRCVLVFTLAGSLAACEQGMKDMYHQDKYEPLDASQLWKDGRSARPLVPGTVPYSAGVAAETSSGVHGEIVPSAEPAPATPAGPGTPASPASQASQAMLRRGEERYGIFCTPCHGRSGDGNGYIVLRGFPRPPSYHIDRLRSAPDSYIYEVISNGHGVMYGYGDRIDESDRWAIVGYIRSLQLAHRELLTDAPPAPAPAARTANAPAPAAERTASARPPSARGPTP